MLSFILLVCLCTLFLATSGEFMSRDYDSYNTGLLGHRPHHEFYSSTERSPVLQVNTWNQAAVAGGGSHIFLRNDGQNEADNSSPLVLDARDLSTVYMNRSFDNVFGTRVQENYGQKYLTFWEGHKGNGIGNGYGLAFDENYRLRYKISAQHLHKVHSDLHEFALTGNGTALVTGVDRVSVSTKNWKGWRGRKTFHILDAVFQEIDLETNEALFSWRASDHIDPMDSHEPIGTNWDTYHLNSIQKTEAGNYLISIRHTHSIYLISGTTGDILWTLGGTRNIFVEPTPPANAATVLSFAWQHHARFVPHTNETQLTLFDNHAKVTTHGQCTAGSCSRGLHVSLDTAAVPPTVQFLHEYSHPRRLQAQSQGSLQLLGVKEDGGGGDGAADADAPTPFEHVFIGWGRCPSFTEHDAVTGETLLDVQFSPWHSEQIVDALDNYRAYRMDWKAEPWWDPVMALRASGEAAKDNGDGVDGDGTLDVYVSWNGATEVRSWAVRGLLKEGVSSDSKLMLDRSEAPLLASSERTGFETKMNITQTGRLAYLWAEALDADGAVIRKTDVVDFLNGNVTIIPVTDSDFEELLDATLAGTGGVSSWSSWRWFVLGGVAAGLGVVGLGGRLFLQRYELYDRLDRGDDFDSDNDDESDVDMDEVPLGIRYFFLNKEGETAEPWQDYPPKKGLRQKLS